MTFAWLRLLAQDGSLLCCADNNPGVNHLLDIARFETESFKANDMPTDKPDLGRDSLDSKGYFRTSCGHFSHTPGFAIAHPWRTRRDSRESYSGGRHGQKAIRKVETNSTYVYG
jgi:hypothetical protein